MGSRVVYIEQNREKFDIKIPKKFLGFQGDFFQKVPLVAEGIISPITPRKQLFLSKSP